jgi:Mycobacterium membrane protein
MLLVAAVVIAVAGFGVYRLHGVFGSHNNTSTAGAAWNDIVPFDPKHIRLEVFGAPGAVARPRTFSSTSRVIRVRRDPSSPSTPCATWWPTRHHRPGSGPT